MCYNCDFLVVTGARDLWRHIMHETACLYSCYMALWANIDHTDLIIYVNGLSKSRRQYCAITQIQCLSLDLQSGWLKLTVVVFFFWGGGM